MSKKNKKKKSAPRKQTTTVVCRDCGLKVELTSRERYAASRPRCTACGGPVNRPRDMR